MTNRVLSIAALCSLTALTACAGGEEPPTSVSLDATTASPDAAACTPEPCTCGASSGTRACVDGGLDSCRCAITIAPPPLPTDTSGDCLPGQYIGNFDGNAGFVITTTPVTGADFFGGTIPLEIELERMAMGAEFSIVGNGKMRGNANGTFPFEATISGELDCAAKRYTATIVGSVQLFLDGIRNAFTGTMIANYDGQAHALVDGTWMVTGSNADGGLDFALTGAGMWHAEYAPDGGVGDAGASDAGAADAATDAGLDASQP